MALAELPMIGSVLVRRYELVEEIGRGGCAVVFEALDHRLGRVVAVKLPTSSSGDAAKVSRFARESRVLSSIHHPNVCGVLDSGIAEDGTPFLVMERLFGESLRESVARLGRLRLGEAIAVGIQLLCALEAVHAAGIVHRDVKPDNIILVTRGGCDPLVKLLDFGLCRRAASRRREEETMTCEGAIVGTPEYMAPEQVLGSMSLDVRVDLYAVGVILYEALTGDRAFFSNSLRDTLSGVMTKKIRPLRRIRPDAPASLEAIVARAMNREPARRYQSAVAFQADLIAVRAEVSRLATPPPRPRPVPRQVNDAWDFPTRRFQRAFPRPGPRPPPRSATRH
jgi:serine/threonine-protein kinase